MVSELVSKKRCLMSASIISRVIRSRLHTAVIWAMVPLAAVSGQSVLGCMAADGKFDPNCQCWAGPATNATSCPCHCACCGTAKCCCKSKTHACNSLADQNRPTNNKGLRDSNHFRPVAMYLAVTAVHALQQLSVDCGSDSLPCVIDACAVVNCSGMERIAELATGPPPDNFVIALHRWVI
jgi:hypothetical protein